MAALLLVNRNSLMWFDADGDAPVHCELTAEAIQDLEVVNEDVLASSIGACFPKPAKDKKTPVIVVLSDEVCFSQTLVPQKESEITKAFSGFVPFAHVVMTTVTINKSKVLYAVNQDMYEAIGHGLTRGGFSVVGVIPWAALVAAGVSVHGELDKQTVKRAYDAWNSLKSVSFPFEQKTVVLPVTAVPTEQAKKKFPIGWVIFGVLALVYAIVMLVFVM
jgi:hypothetical protein